jgi:hypothetical protein
MTDEMQPGQITELQSREFASQQLKDQADADAKAKAREDSMMKLLSAVDKGVVTKDEMEDAFKLLTDKIAILEGRLLKERARGFATVPSEREDPNEAVRKAFPGLVARGLL